MGAVNPLNQVQELLKRDPFLLQAARGVAQAKYWYELQGNGEIIWGTYKSSRSKCQTVVDLRYEKAAFRCTCQSRKNPCKHGVAIVLMLMDHQEAFTVVTETPEEVLEWITKRDQRLQPKNRTAEEEAALAEKRRKNREKRLDQMLKGLEELELWIRDAVKEGLAKLYSQPNAYWTEWSAHFVNAKLGNLGKRFLSFPAIFQQEDWHEILLGELGELYLLIRGFRQYDQLPEGLQQELFTAVGVNIQKKELLEEKGITDVWKVLAKHEGKEDNLSFQRTWLYGKESKRFALHLDYAWGRQPFQQNWAIGTALKGELIFYPAGLPLRAFFKQFHVVNQTFSPNGLSDFNDFSVAYSKAIGANPWLWIFPAFLENVIPVVDEQEQLYLVDWNKKQLPCHIAEEWLAWQIYALSGGHPIHVFGEWTKDALIPLAAEVDGRWVDFSINLTQA